MTIQEMNKRLQTLETFSVTDFVQCSMNSKTTISYRIGPHTGTITEPNPAKAIEHIVRMVMLSSD